MLDLALTVGVGAVVARLWQQQRQQQQQQQQQHKHDM
jgi:uncharacterized membrane-anchored protein YhcB (DUF1043 family)